MMTVPRHQKCTSHLLSSWINCVPLVCLLWWMDSTYIDLWL